MAPHRVVLLPGAVLPAGAAYEALLAALGDRVDPVVKDLELYSTPDPPLDYSLDHEVAGIVAAVDERGWDSFHLLGYSGGGAAALAFTAKHRERVESLALLEPAWAGSWDRTPDEDANWAAQQELEHLSPDDFMPQFVRLSLREGVQPPAPPVGTPPPWMAKRPGGIKALINTFQTYDLDRFELSHFDRPVYFALGALSNPHQYTAIAMRLAEVFPDFRLEVFQDRHHFDPPHRVEPERLAASLLSVWEGAKPGETG